MNQLQDCIICYEKLENVSPLLCGHIIHLHCVKQHFKPECPLCRTPLNIEVNGSLPESNIVFGTNTEEEDSDEDSDEDTDHLDYKEQDEDSDEESSWRRKGYLYAEEDENWDEENPFGDNYDYGLY